MSDKKIMKTLNGYTVYDEDAHRRIDSLAGSAPGLVFDTVADMEAYVAEHHADLKVGQNLYIREVDVPDYWWDGTAVQELETKADLSGYAKQTEVDKLSEAIADLENKIPADVSGMTAAQIYALDGMFKIASYTTDPTAAYSAFKTAFGIEDGGEVEPDEPETPTKTLTSISAVYSGGDVAVGTTLTDLTGIVVTATYSDGSTAAVTGYTLSGEIAEGKNTITVSYSGKTTTFTVTGVAESADENNGWTDGVEYADVAWESGYGLNGTTGEAQASETHSVTDYLPCKGVDAFSTVNALNFEVSLYDDAKNFIGKRELLKTGDFVSSYICADGNTPAYFRTAFRTSNIEAGRGVPFIVPHKLPVATPTTVLEAGKHYIPEFKVGYSVWNATGAESVAENSYCTDFIFIKDFASVSISKTDTINRKFVGFYDAEKNYISGEANNIVTRTIQDGAYYCRITTNTLPGIRWWIMVNEAEEAV